MLTLFTHGAPNPRKITIFLEEAALPYECRLVELYEGKHRDPQFLRVNPNGRLPALLDPDGVDGPQVLWESGAILQYLAEKTGQFLPRSGPRRYDVLKWLYFQVAHAPYLGNAQVLNDQLAQCEYVAGTDYSIADMAWYPWIEYREWQGQRLSDFPHLRRWFELLSTRPAVRRGASIPWPYTECGPSEAGRRAQALIERRLKGPAFALTALPQDAAMANLGF